MGQPNEIVACPYNKSHMILRHRMPKHLIKCVKNYHGSKLVTCPYNAMHRVPEEKLKDHIENDCSDYVANFEM